MFLPGRNVLLLAKALLWCRLHGVSAVALATLQGNPFPDATPAFFTAFGEIVNEAVNARIRILSPFAGLRKVDIMRVGQDLPLEWTFSCIRPVAGRHCGRCNKCAEHRQALPRPPWLIEPSMTWGNHVPRDARDSVLLRPSLAEL